MEVKAGYKQTEVGVIPEDWDVVNLSSLSKGMQNGVFFKPSRKGRGVKLINVGDLYTHIPIDLETLELFDATNDEVARFMVESGDLFFTRSSVVPSGIAHCNIYLSSKSEAVVFDSHVIRCRPDAKKVNSSYLFRYCVASVARNYLVSHAKTGTMTTIDQGVLAKCPIILPPTLAEQEAIAEALSDADAFIEALEQLIAKKRQVKQGAMQELLTGKRRLHGFSGEWTTKLLGDISHIQTGGRNNQDKVEDGEYNFFVRSATIERINTYSYDCEAILVPGEGNIGSIFHYINGRFDVHQRVYAITQFQSDVSAKFVYLQYLRQL